MRRLAGCCESVVRVPGGEWLISRAKRDVEEKKWTDDMRISIPCG